MPMTIRARVTKAIMDGRRGAPCIMYDAAAGRCDSYEHRPEVCRNFEVGGTGCLYERGKAGWT